MCKWSYKPPQIDRQQQLFLDIAGVFPPQNCVNIHLKAPEQQTAKMSSFIEMLTLADVGCIFSQDCRKSCENFFFSHDI